MIHTLRPFRYNWLTLPVCLPLARLDYTVLSASRIFSISCVRLWREAVRCRLDGRAGAPRAGALAHGAGGARDSPFRNSFAAGLEAAGLRAARFEFPYMAEGRKDGKSRPPDRIDVLRDSWLEAIAALGRMRCVGENGRVTGFEVLVEDQVRFSAQRTQ